MRRWESLAALGPLLSTAQTVPHVLTLSFLSLAFAAVDFVPVVQTGLSGPQLVTQDPLGERLFVLGKGPRLSAWSISGAAMLWETKAEPCPLLAQPSLRLEGQRLVVDCQPGPISSFDAANGKSLTVIGDRSPSEQVIAFDSLRNRAVLTESSRDGRWGHLELYEVGAEKGRPLMFMLPAGASAVGRFSSDGARFVLLFGDTIRVWATETAELLAKVELASGALSRLAVGEALALSSAGEWLALAWDGELTLAHLIATPTVMKLGPSGDAGVVFDAGGSLHWQDKAGCLRIARPPDFKPGPPSKTCVTRPTPLPGLEAPVVLSEEPGQQAVELLDGATGASLMSFGARFTPIKLHGIDETTGALLVEGAGGWVDMNWGLASLDPTTLSRTRVDSLAGGRLLALRGGRSVWLSHDDFVVDGKFVRCGSPVADAPWRTRAAADLDGKRLLRASADDLWMCDFKGKVLLHQRLERCGGTGQAPFVSFKGKDPLVADACSGLRTWAGGRWKKAAQFPLEPDCSVFAVVENGAASIAVSPCGLARSSSATPRAEGVLEAAVSRDRRLLATGNEDVIRLHDGLTGDELASARSPNLGRLTGLTFSRGAERLFVTGSSGALEVYALPSLKLVATRLVSGEGIDLTVLPQGHYLASKAGAAALTGRTSEGQLADPRDFDFELNRPDLVLEALGAKPELVTQARALVTARQSRLGAQKRGLPALRWARVPPLATTSSKLELHVAVPAGQKEARVVFSINGVRVAGPELLLTRGLNRISAWLEDANGNRGPRLRHVLNADIIEPQPDVYFLGVGISEYKQRDRNLSWAAKDVRDVDAALKRLLGARYRSRLLLDATATAAEVEASRSFLAPARPHDVVLVYLASHGVREGERYYFAPHDTDFTEIAKTAMPWERLEALLGATASRNRVLFMDTCQSGELDIAGEFTGAAQALAVEAGGMVRVRALRAPEVVSASAMTASGLLPARVTDRFLDLREETGAHVIAAAGPAEFAFESSQWSNGVFSYSVLEALGEGGDLDRDGRVTVSELLRRVTDSVTRLTGGQQVPASRRENTEADFALVSSRPSTALDTGDAYIASFSSAGADRVLLAAARTTLRCTADGGCAERVVHEQELGAILAVSPDGALALRGHDDTPVLIDFASGEQKKLKAKDSVAAAAFSPDASQLVLVLGWGLEVVSLRTEEPNRLIRSVDFCATGMRCSFESLEATRMGWAVFMSERTASFDPGSKPTPAFALLRLDARWQQTGERVPIALPGEAPLSFIEHPRLDPSGAFVTAVVAPEVQDLNADAILTELRNPDARKNTRLEWDSTTGALVSRAPWDGIAPPSKPGLPWLRGRESSRAVVSGDGKYIFGRRVMTPGVAVWRLAP